VGFAGFGGSFLEGESGDAAEVGEDEFGEVVAVAALEEAQHGDIEVGEGVSEPVEVLGFEALLAEGVTGVGVEAGGDGDEAGVKVLEVLQGFEGDVAVVMGGEAWGDGVIEAIIAAVAAAGAGVSGELVNGEEGDTWAADEDGFSSIAVVDIEVEDSDAFDACGAGGEGRDGDGAEVAEAHGVLADGVMAWGAEEGETVFVAEGAAEGAEGAADAAAGVLGYLGVGGGIEVEVDLFFESFEVCWAMGSEEDLVIDGLGFEPFDMEVVLAAEFQDRFTDTLGAFRVAWCVVLGAGGVGYDVNGGRLGH
jgi:hypothetical protein